MKLRGEDVAREIEKKYFASLGLLKIKGRNPEVMRIKSCLNDLTTFYQEEGGPFLFVDKCSYFLTPESNIEVFIQTYMPKIFLNNLIVHAVEFEITIEILDNHPFGPLVNLVKVRRNFPCE